MHRFICMNAHTTYSAAREPLGRCGVDGCNQQAKLADSSPAQQAEVARVVSLDVERVERANRQLPQIKVAPPARIRVEER